MKQHSITYFVMRTLLATLPMIVFVAIYAIIDPFKVIHRYDEPSTPADTIALGNNAGFESIMCLQRNIEAGHEYDSFILGSSMSQAYRAEAWAQYLPQGAQVFHLDASEETLQGMVDKLNYLDRKRIKVNNALIIIEEAMMHRMPCDDNFLFVRPWATASDVSWLHFQLQFFNVYKNPLMVKYSMWPERYRSEMIAKRFATTFVHHHTDSTNENIFTSIDSLIACNPAAYYTPQRLRANHINILPSVDCPGITPAIERSLAQLGEWLQAHGTHYLVLIPPRYHRQLPHAQDLALLNHYLGSNHVVDMSRHPYSSDPQAYYDWAAHLTTARCDTLLMEAYGAIKR